MGTLSNTKFLIIFLLLIINACARDLKQDSDLAETPKDFKQKFSKSNYQYTPKSIDENNEKLSVQLPSDSPNKILSPKSSHVVTKPSLDNKVKSTDPSTVNAKNNAKVIPPKISSSVPTKVEATKKTLRSKSTHWPISIGEKSKIALRWGLIEGGIVTLEVKPPQQIEDRPVLHFHGEVQSSKVMNLIYKIDNSIDTWVDLETLMPVRQEIKQLESGRWGRRILLFTPSSKRVKFYEHITKKTGEVNEIVREDKVTKGAQDLFGAFYFYRFIHHLSDGFRYPIHDKGKNWSVDLKYIGRETLRVPAGTFNTLRYKVLLKLDGHMESRGDVEAWVTDDDKRIMVRFNAKIKVGSVSGDLIEYTPGQKIDLPLPVWKSPVKATIQGSEENAKLR